MLKCPGNYTDGIERYYWKSRCNDGFPDCNPEKPEESFDESFLCGMDVEDDNRTKSIRASFRSADVFENITNSIPIKGSGPIDFEKSSCTQDDNFGQGDRVVGGHDAREFSWPWIVRLEITDSKMNKGICGGTIVGNNHILTGKYERDGFRKRGRFISV